MVGLSLWYAVSLPQQFCATGVDAGEFQSGAQSLTFTEGRADASGPSGTVLVGSCLQ